MADKMMRIAGRDDNNRARGIRTSEKGEVVTRGVVQSMTIDNITLSQGTFYEMPLFDEGGGSSFGVVCQSNDKTEISFQWRKANRDYAADQRFMKPEGYSTRHYFRADKLTNSFRVLIWNQSNKDLTVNTITVTEFA